MRRSTRLRGSFLASSLLRHCVSSAADSRALYCRVGLGGRDGDWVDGPTLQWSRRTRKDGNHHVANVMLDYPPLYWSPADRRPTSLDIACSTERVVPFQAVAAPRGELQAIPACRVPRDPAEYAGFRSLSSWNVSPPDFNGFGGLRNERIEEDKWPEAVCRYPKDDD